MEVEVSKNKKNKLIVNKKISRRDAIKSIGYLAIGALASPALIRSAHAANPIKVGVISPLSGAWTVYGKAHIAGFELAVDEINAKGGVLGRKMELVIGDSKN